MNVVYFFSIWSVTHEEILHSSEFCLDLAPPAEGSVLCHVFDGGAIREQTAVGPHLLVLGALKLGESPLLGHVDLLASRELELGSPESLDDCILMLVVSPDGHERLSNVDTGDGSLRLAEGSPHSGLQTISACARQHFVDAQNVERMDTDLDVELILGRVLHHVLVAADTAGLESLSRELLVFIGDEMDAEWEVVDVSLLAAQIEDPDLGIWHTTAEPRLGVRLVLAVPVTPCRTATHLVTSVKSKIL